MKILTSAGLKKLAALKDELINLQMVAGGEEHKSAGPGSKEHKGVVGSSAYSKQMVQTVIDIITLLTEHNDVSFWQKKDNKKILRAKLAFLDGGNGSYVPDVFNAESRQLAEKMLALLNANHFGDFFESGIETVLKTVVGDPNKFMAVIKQTCESRLKLHTIVSAQESKEVKEAIDTYTKENHELCQAFDKLEKDCKKPDANKKELIVAFEESYKAKIGIILSLIGNIPYIKIMTEDGLVSGNNQNPYLLNTLQSRGQRAMLVWNLIGLEKVYNLMRKKVELPPITLVYDHFSKNFSPAALADLKNRLLTLSKDFILKSTFYKAGKHLGMFKSVDQGKKDLIDELNLFITNKLEAKNFDKLWPSTGMISFEIFSEMMKVHGKNLKYSQSKNISPGELSRMLAKESERFLMLSVCDVNQTCDSGVLRELSFYAKELGLNSPIPDAKAGNTHSAAAAARA